MNQPVCVSVPNPVPVNLVPALRFEVLVGTTCLQEIHLFTALLSWEVNFNMMPNVVLVHYDAKVNVNKLCTWNELNLRTCQLLSLGFNWLEYIQ